jgi:hypothetical protein
MTSPLIPASDPIIPDPPPAAQPVPSLPPNVTGATIGAAISVIVLWLLTLLPVTVPDGVAGAISLLTVAALTWLGGWIEHRGRKAAAAK